MKSVKTKAFNVVICWSSLKSIPPKDFPTIQEMEKVPTILELFEEAIPNYVKIIKEGEKLNDDIISGEIPGDNVKQVKDDWGKKSKAIDNSERNKEVELEFENEDFNTFFQQFERWGKNWFSDVKEFLNFRRCMTDANSAPYKKAGK
jgi:hypothetical protein